MALYSFNLESFSVVACRGKSGQDDDWLIVTVHVGTRISNVVTWPIAFGIQPGLSLSGLEALMAGPFAMQDGETGIATYTIVNLGGEDQDEQALVATALGASIQAAVTNALRTLASPGTAPATTAIVEAAIREIFGGAGELTDPALPAGTLDCRGLVGLHIAPFTALTAPNGDEVVLSAPVTLTETSSTACGAPPQSTAVFAMRLGKNLFANNVSTACLPYDPSVPNPGAEPVPMEVFAVGLDGKVYRNLRLPDGTSGSWNALGDQQFSQRAPLAAVNRMPKLKDLFGTGVDGVIYNLRWTPAAGWPQQWSPVSAPGQFLPDTPVMAVGLLSLTPMLYLFATGPDGTACGMSWNGDSVVKPWATIGPMPLNPARPVVALSAGEFNLDLFGIGTDNLEYHAALITNSPQGWGGWQRIGGSAALAQPAQPGLCGLTFDFLVKPNQAMGLGMALFRIDGAGQVLAMVCNLVKQPFSDRQIVPGLTTFPAASGGWVQCVYFSTQLKVFACDAKTKTIQESMRPAPSGVAGVSTGWTAWTALPPGPPLDGATATPAISSSPSGIELFLIDTDGQVQHTAWTNAAGWVAWSVV